MNKVQENKSEVPKEGNTLQKKMTFDPEYIKDREKIDALSRTMMNQIAQLNKHLKMVQITDFSYKLNEPTSEVAKTKTIKARWRRLLRFFGL